MEKYFNKSKQLFGNDFTQTISIHKDKLSLLDNSNLDTISINEYKLIKMLLEEVKIYKSSENPIIYAEGKNGYAYVLGRKDNKQLKF
jgi:hypothetical protein